MATYKEALKLLQIETGFLEEQLESNFSRLEQEYNPDQYEFLSPEYEEASTINHELFMAYCTLHSYYKTYIVSSTSKPTIDNEILEEELLRTINDAVANGKEIDENFIAQVVEILVCNLGLNDYVRSISFEKYGDKSLASYTRNCQIKVFLGSIKRSIEESSGLILTPLEKKYNPYCQVTEFLRHEVEHANQVRILVVHGSDTETRILTAENERNEMRDRELNRIVKYPFLLYHLALMKRKIGLSLDKKKYDKYWGYISSERMANIRSYNLILNLLSRLSQLESYSFSNLERVYMENLGKIVTFGYDKTFAPILFYLEKFKQYGDCLDILKMSENLELADRLALGLKATPLELESFEKNKEKVMVKIRTM